jgi:predicted nucleotidyltransferase
MSFDPRPFAEHYKKANAAELRVIQDRANQARKEARHLAELIVAGDPDVREIVLFGSLAEEGPRRLDFDIDLGMVGGDLSKALQIIEGSPFKVDLVDLDRIPAHIKSRIAASGIQLRRRGDDQSSSES